MSDSSERSEKHSPLDFTFGVEIEHLFGIRQDDVAKKEGYGWLRPENCPPNANIPALSLPQEYDPEKSDDRIRRENAGLRQAAKLIRQKAALNADTIQVRLHPKSYEEEDANEELGANEYTSWKLIIDNASRVPKTKEDIEKWSDGKIQDIDGWEFSRLELISRVLTAPKTGSSAFDPQGLAELQRYLTYIPEVRPWSPYFFLTHPEVGSVHVHVGREPTAHGQNDLPLDFLKHLAFICLVFEDALTLLHHPERHGYRGTKIWGHGRSNRVVPEPDNYRSQHHCELGRTFSDEDAFFDVFKSVDLYTFQDVLHPPINPQAEDDEEDKNHKAIIRPREWFVNFSNACQQDDEHGKKTVEFRQHHGTLDANDIREWVVFVIALARAAERKANAEESGSVPPSLVQKLDSLDKDQRGVIEKQAKKYPDFFQPNKKRNLEELFDLLKLTNEQRRYWWARAEKNRKLWAEKYKGKSTCIHCSCKTLPCMCAQTPETVCNNTTTRDCEGWGDDELVCPKYDDETDSDSESRQKSDGPSPIDYRLNRVSST